MPELNVRKLKATEYDTWGRFVAVSPQGTRFHKSYWLQASGKSSEFTDISKDVSEDKNLSKFTRGFQIAKVMPLIEVL